MQARIGNLGHPVRRCKYQSIFDAICALADKGQKITYSLIRQMTSCSSRTISKFFRWCASAGIFFKRSRLDEIGQTIEKLKGQKLMPTYRKIREVLGCSFATISKFFKGARKDKDEIPYQEILDFLNQKAGTSFKLNRKFRRLISSLWKRGYSLGDVKLVIEFKVSQWAGTEWSQYLRPKTLFGPRFAEYLQGARGARNIKPSQPQSRLAEKNKTGMPAGTRIKANGQEYTLDEHGNAVLDKPGCPEMLPQAILRALQTQGKVEVLNA